MHLFFDGLIFGFLILALAGFFLSAKYGTHFWSVKANILLRILLVLCMSVVFFGSFIEPRLLVVTHESIQLKPNASNVLNAAVVSDIHVGPYQTKRDVEALVDTIVETHPDLIFLLGDFVEQESFQAEQLAPFLTITDVYPTYAILGNHDYQLGSNTDPANHENAAEIKATLESFGIRVLQNEGTLSPDASLFIAGVDELWTDRADIQASLSTRPATKTPTILLTHNPDIVFGLLPLQGIDLVLAGHTHGGQIRLPLLGPVPPLPTKLGRDFDKGLFDYLGTQLFITSGVGESGPRARLFNPPEIAILTIEY
jgi:predicted MPP superfamily phosphohydrolase